MRWFRWIVIVIIITVVRVCAVRHLRSRTKIFPIVEKHLLRRVSSSRTRARNSVRRIILQRRSIFPVPVPTRGWESKSCHYSLRTIESNRVDVDVRVPGVCPHRAFKRTSRARPGKNTPLHTHTERERPKRTRSELREQQRAAKDAWSRAIISD